jgi:hypothetical protein
MPDDIIVTGGSVTVDIDDSYQPQVSGPPGKKQYKRDKRKLVGYRINGGDVQPLGKRDKITIVCEEE